MSSAQTNGQLTAGIIIIGDEILRGSTTDTNSHFMCKRLFSLGVKVKRVSIIDDNVAVIAKEVSKFSALYSYVFTSGGIGPTHDDVTHEGVAMAFGEQVLPHPEYVEMCKKYFDTDVLSLAQTKLCEVAKSAVLHRITNPATGLPNKFPLVSVRNVYIFPGIPFLLEKAFIAAEHMFKNAAVTFHTKEFYVTEDELKIAAQLADMDAKYRNKVLIGSYPNIRNSYYKVMVTLESDSEEELKTASAHLTQVLPSGSIVAYDNDPISHASERVYGLLDSPKNTGGNEDDKIFYKNLREAVNVLEEAFKRYSLQEICLSFNGGKDSTALLHLFHAVVKNQLPEWPDKLQALYIRCQLPFPEVEQFIQQSRDRYNLDLTRLDGTICDSLISFKTTKPEVLAIVMGTRCTDPKSSNLNSFTPTDSDWPQYMRINPLLNWRYQDVWRFLRTLSLPYCNLYDKGYTSLGSMNNTHPNRWLQYSDSNGVICYKPAYKLSQDDMERSGRN